jgi:hypothetical protein
MAISVALLLVFVKKGQARTAFFAFMLAQLFSWPLTILYVLFGLQQNPVRLFPHATESNFLFAFIFHPSVFAVYYLKYPKRARRSLRFLYTALITPLPLLTMLLTAYLTNLIYFPHKAVFLATYIIIIILFTVSRIYIDRYLSKVHHPARNQ